MRDTFTENGVTRAEVIQAAHQCFKRPYNTVSEPCGDCRLIDEASCFQHMPTDPIAAVIIELDMRCTELEVAFAHGEELHQAVDALKAEIWREIAGAISKLLHKKPGSVE